MKHGIVVDGFRFRLRPMRVDDASFMLDLRQRDGIREHVNTTSSDIDDQRSWIGRCIEDETDHSFVLVDVRSNERNGSFSIYDGDGRSRRARIGRWLVRPGSKSVPEFALLGYSACFEVLRLDRVFCRIPDDNAAALAFQRRIGSTPKGEAARVELNGRRVALLEFELPAAAWPRVRGVLQPLAEALHGRSTLRASSARERDETQAWRGAGLVVSALQRHKSSGSPVNPPTPS